jgi:hypothetical protein
MQKIELVTVTVEKVAKLYRSGRRPTVLVTRTCAVCNTRV